MDRELERLATGLASGQTCSECGDAIKRGYVPVAAVEGNYDVLTGLAVCDTCGWSDVGHMGCAPELRDFDAGDLLVRVEREDGGLEPVAVTDED